MSTTEVGWFSSTTFQRRFHTVLFLLVQYRFAIVCLENATDKSQTSGNCIENETWNDAEYLHDLPSDTIAVVFTGHNLGVLTSRTLFGDNVMHDLLSLDLTDNNITQICPGAFSSTPNVTNLTLANNKWLIPEKISRDNETTTSLTLTATDVFSGLRDLRHLNLHSAFDLIGEVYDEHFDNDSASNDSHIFVDDSDRDYHTNFTIAARRRQPVNFTLFLGYQPDVLGNMRTLHLDYNDMSEFDVRAILGRSMPYLRHLNLAGNLLKSFDFRAVAMRYVRTVRIDKNLITWFDRESIANMIVMNSSMSLQWVNITGNPFECTCRNRWMVQWIHISLNATRRGSSRFILDADKLICWRPRRLRGWLVHEVRLNDIDTQLCREHPDADDDVPLDNDLYSPASMGKLTAGVSFGLLIFIVVTCMLARDRKSVSKKRMRKESMKTGLLQSNYSVYDTRRL